LAPKLGSNKQKGCGRTDSMDHLKQFFAILELNSSERDLFCRSGPSTPVRWAVSCKMIKARMSSSLEFGTRPRISPKKSTVSEPKVSVTMVWTGTKNPPRALSRTDWRSGSAAAWTVEGKKPPGDSSSSIRPKLQPALVIVPIAFAPIRSRQSFLSRFFALSNALLKVPCCFDVAFAALPAI